MLLLTTFLTSFLISGILVYSKKWHQRFSGDHDLFGPQKFHQKNTPRIGGLAIFIGFQIGLGILSYSKSPIAQEYFYISIAVLPVFISGLSEDLTKIVGVKWRLICAFCSGLIFSLLFEIQTIRLDVIYLDTLLQNPWITIVFLCFSIAGLANAYNIIDGFNGLASMVGIISLAAIFFVAAQVDDRLITTFALMAIGAIGGFFLWNYPRGLIFLGDGGAYWIGFLIACLSILLVFRHDIISPWFALMVNAYPTLETLFTIWRRTIYQGKNMSQPDGVHFHSLIYRRILRRTNNGCDKPNNFYGNAKTSPYLWILSSIGIIPAILWWQSSTTLMICAACYIYLYISLYRKLVRFQTPKWINHPPAHK